MGAREKVQDTGIDNSGSKNTTPESVLHMRLTVVTVICEQPIARVCPKNVSKKMTQSVK